MVAKSVLAVINAKRIYRSAPVLDTMQESVYESNINAVLIVDGIISFIGETADVMSRFAVLEEEVHALPEEEAPVEGGRKRKPFARTLDCQYSKVIYPGFVESHAHLLDGGRALNSPQLDHACSKQEFIETLQRFVSHQYVPSDGSWIIGGGWSESVLGGETPTREWLDAVSSEIPIVLHRKDVHSCVLNTAALRACHIIPAIATNEKDSCDGTSADDLLREVPGGRIELDENGVPNGILRDNAIQAIAKYMPQTDSATEKQNALASATEYFLSRGFTTVFSMMSTRFRNNSPDVRFLSTQEKEGNLRLRVRFGIPIDLLDELLSDYYRPVKDSDRSDAFTLPYRFTCIPPALGGSFFFLGAVKLFGDGALGSKTAAMNRPYGYDVQTEGDLNSELDDSEIAKFLVNPDRPECQCGLLILQRPELTEAVRKTHEQQMQVVAHAIGDRAVANVNRALSEASEQLKRNLAAAEVSSSSLLKEFSADPRSRVEHCQHIANITKEVHRMNEGNIIASMQPCHLLFDGDYVEPLIGLQRKNKSYMWGTFLKNGVRVDFGSDWPVAPADVSDGLRGATTRVPDVMATLAAEKNGTVLAGAKRFHETWNAAEIISMDSALRCYTYEGAHGAFLEDFVGSVEVGKYGDLSIWSGDWLETENRKPLGENPQQWWSSGEEPKVCYTIVGGLVEYEYS